MQFVLLEHTTAAGVHWDLMLETAPGSALLKTWRLAQNPVANPAEIEAQPLPDHRRDYLDYEGPISADRGAVRRLDRGAALHIERQGAGWSFELMGARLNGRFALVGGPARLRLVRST